MSDENITAPITSDYKLNPELIFFSSKTKVELNGSCLKQDLIMETFSSKHLHCLWDKQKD